jgi:hypothetical protein
MDTCSHFHAYIDEGAQKHTSFNVEGKAWAQRAATNTPMVRYEAYFISFHFSWITIRDMWALQELPGFWIVRTSGAAGTWIQTVRTRDNPSLS